MPWNSPKRPQYWNFSSGFDFDHITAVDISFCTSLRNFIQIGPPSAKNKKLSCRRETARRFVSLNILLIHPRSLKSLAITLLSRGCVSLYLYFIETMSISYRFRDIQRQRMTWPWNWRYKGTFKVIGNGALRYKYFLLVRHCIYIALSGTVFELLDVEKYRDLEIWVRGHGRSFKLAPFESPGAVSYSPSIVTMAVSLTICIQHQRTAWFWKLGWGLFKDQGHWKWRCLIDHIRLSIGPLS